MADRLTQLQDCLDDLATQMFASINYIQTRHALAPIQGQPDMTSQDQATAQADGQPEEPLPDKPEVFSQALRELARDLVLKEQQIEHLISVLPGIGSSEESQNARIKALEAELREADLQRKKALEQRDQMLDTVSELAAQCKRVY